MPPPTLLDPASIDLSRVVLDRAAIENLLPQRHEFQLVDAIVLLERDTGIFAGYHDIEPNAWWARGHVPGRPLFPGVLMIEVAAQLSSCLYTYIYGAGRFLGFGGVDKVKFRDTVQPPTRFVVVGKALQLKPRRTICAVQGFVGSTMVFEGEITGMPV